MSIVALEEVKATQAKLADMIEKIETEMRENSFFEYGGKRIPLALGERYLCTVISPDGKFHHHSILLPGEADPADWKTQMSHAESIGASVWNRVESLIALATMPDEFKKEAYWTSELHVSDSDSAYYQGFYYGYQGYDTADGKLRARFVRRLPI